MDYSAQSIYFKYKEGDLKSIVLNVEYNLEDIGAIFWTEMELNEQEKAELLAVIKTALSRVENKLKKEL